MSKRKREEIPKSESSDDLEHDCDDDGCGDPVFILSNDETDTTNDDEDISELVKE